ncbi:hypothetical protein PCANC_09935 [Puccinia coronata f. sp. avenae]|uniref:Uncharacterized protein n=1 Tax=Puccinia coronata f. sp. avenae TaxID=200324 RepID=A0A2N5V350_9BASI|nr:hypothetical protein PCANC_09935 [Puccinia coronata f. sp. avenae]
MSDGNQPAGPATIQFAVQYLLYTQIPEIGLPCGVLAKIKSPCLGRVVEIEAVQSLFKTFKALIFDHLRASSNKYPVNEIGRHADHKGLLNWYYAICEPDCEPVKGFLISLPPYFAKFMSWVKHASTNAKIAIKLWMSHMQARELPAAILEISVLDSGLDQGNDECNTASTPAFGSRSASDSLAASVQSPARPPPHAARHVHAYNRRAHGEQACQTGVQSLHACLEGVQSLHALWTGVQALHACGLTTLIRVPKYPYKGTLRTLIRVPVPL